MPHLRFCLFVWLMPVTIGTAQHAPRLLEQTDWLVKVRQAERQALAKNDSLGLAEAWYQYGKEYERVGDNERAGINLQKALRWWESHRDSVRLLNVYCRLSELEQRQNHLPEALYYAQNALQIAKATNAIPGLVEAYRRLGHVRSFIWDMEANQVGFDNVFACYTKSRQLATQIHDTLGMAEADVHLGALVMAVNPGAAFTYLKRALPLFVHLRHDEWQIKTLIHLSDAYRRTGNLPMAWQCLQQAKHMYGNPQANEHGILAMLEDRTSQYYRVTGQWEKALNHFERLNQLEKQQLLADRDGAITRLNLEYETEKKQVLLTAQQRELSLRDQNLHIQQRFTTASLVLLVGAVGVSIIFFGLYRKNRRISLQNETLVKEQNHRVKNNLQVVASLLSLQARQLTDETARRAVLESRLRVESMSIIHRRLYDGDRLAQVHVPELMQELVNGVLRAYGFPAVQTEWMINDLYLPADKAIPLGLILNELTTNACKYAFPGHPWPRFSVHFYRRTNTLHLTVSDNGPGLDSPGLDGSEFEFLEKKGKTGLTGVSADSLLLKPPRVSFGMSLIRAQVAQLYGTHRFSAPTTGTGVVFTMEFTD